MRQDCRTDKNKTNIVHEDYYVHVLFGGYGSQEVLTVDLQCSIDQLNSVVHS